MTCSHLEEYKNKSFLVLPSEQIFPENSIERKMCVSFFSVKFYESDDTMVRFYYKSHRNPEISKWLQENETIKFICQTIFGKQEIYIHKSKINIKNKTKISVLPYSRDFPFWNVFDGIEKNRLLNLVIFLYDLNKRNGDLSFILGSQHHFLERENDFAKQEFSMEGSASSNLLFDFSEAEDSALSERFDEEICTGHRGSLLLYDLDTINGSSFSYEDFSRKLLILTFRVCSNQPQIPALRPDYICSPDFTPLQWN